MPNPLSKDEQVVLKSISKLLDSLEISNENLEQKKIRLASAESDLAHAKKWHDDAVARVRELEASLEERRAYLQKLWSISAAQFVLPVGEGKSSLSSTSIDTLESRSEVSDAGPGWA